MDFIRMLMIQPMRYMEKKSVVIRGYPWKNEILFSHLKMQILISSER